MACDVEFCHAVFLEIKNSQIFYKNLYYFFELWYIMTIVIIENDKFNKINKGGILLC